MRSAILLGVLCAVGAMSSPVQKRAYETDLTVVTVTRTVTGRHAPTADVDPVNEKQVAQAQSQPAPSSIEESSAAPVSTQAPTQAPPPPAPTTTSSAVVTSAPAPAPAPTTSTSTSSSASASTAAPSSGTSDDYQAVILQNHNMHRANHSADALAWSSDLESSAKQLADSCVYEHNTKYGGGGYGQNIGYGIPSSAIGKMITNLMYNDEFDYFSNLYGEANPDMSDFEKWGHFSQIVWKGTKQVGCYTTVCDKLQNVDSDGPIPFTACNYSPAGNYAGEYADNISKPQGHAFFAVA